VAHAWSRRAKESKEAFAAFQHYLREGSIDAAYAAHLATKGQQKGDGKRAPRRWATWSADNEWVARASAYQDHLAEQNRQLWEQRRRDLQERDWAQADALRTLVDAALPGANQFIRRKTTTLPSGEVVITMAFDLTALAKVLTDASKLQRQATGQSTEHIELSGAALDAAIERITRGLAGLDDGGQAQATDASATDQPAGDSAPDRADAPATGGDEALPS
jgi:hypothetical protein